MTLFVDGVHSLGLCTNSRSDMVWRTQVHTWRGDLWLGFKAPCAPGVPTSLPSQRLLEILHQHSPKPPSLVFPSPGGVLWIQSVMFLRRQDSLNNSFWNIVRTVKHQENNLFAQCCQHIRKPTDFEHFCLAPNPNEAMCRGHWQGGFWRNRFNPVAVGDSSWGQWWYLTHLCLSS